MINSREEDRTCQYRLEFMNNPIVAATATSPSSDPGIRSGQFKNRSTSQYYLELILHLVQRDFVLRYKGSVLGILWVLLIPLTHLLVLVFLFVRVVPLNIEAYPAFVFVALLPWTWFSNSLNGAGTLFINNKDLLRRPNFPPLILVVVNTLSNLLLYLIVFPILIATIFAYGHSLSWTTLYFPLLILVQGILITGLSMMIATWNVFYRDVQQIVNVLVMLLFYITPVFYRAHAVDPGYQFLFVVNPIAVLVRTNRDALFYSSPPQWGPLLYTVIVSLAIALLGYQIYKQKIHAVMDAL
jgi:lipopolysaccharide transport system permease protein